MGARQAAEESTATRGMTLVEVVTVVAVIMVLVGLLLPAIIQARRRVAGTQCSNNLRQVTLAWFLYGQDHSDQLPRNVDGLFGGEVNWVAGNMSQRAEWSDRDLLLHPQRSLLAPYLGTPKVFKCPADESIAVRSISMNCRLNPTRDVGVPPRWVGGLGARHRTFRTWTQVQRPAQIFVVIDENATSINDAYFAVDMSNTGDPAGVGSPRPFHIVDYPAGWHGGGAGVSFADGHVEIRKWVESTTFGPVLPGSFTSSNDRDVGWLQEHSTYTE
jgi:prepilin-type processing-associated H-X9-DG protein